MNKLIITCHPTPRSTVEGMHRILRVIQELAASCGVKITWKEEEDTPVDLTVAVEKSTP